MPIVQIKFAPWDKSYDFSSSDSSLAPGDYIVVETDLGQDVGRIIKVGNEAKTESEAREMKPVLRRAEYDDVCRLASSEEKAEAMEACRSAVERLNLPMKLVDVHFSFDKSRINFAFVADGRVDFRELVKELAGRFSANIRLTQIGSRDEARLAGDCGPCGQGLCCRGFISDFSSITSEMAEAQQVVHRGSERISGMCGRLMCCLAYEYEGYKEMAGKLPPLGTKVNIDGIRGTVIGHHVLKQTVTVEIQSDRPGEGRTIVEVDINRKEKQEKERRRLEEEAREREEERASLRTGRDKETRNKSEKRPESQDSKNKKNSRRRRRRRR